MPCDYKSRREMAEAGWSEDEIVEMEKEIQLARAKANRAAAQAGCTRTQQRNLEDIAEKEARVTAHDRMHRKLKDLLDAITGGAAKEIVHANSDSKGHLSAEGRDKLRKLGFDA
jgi:hypothetical protein